MHFADLPALRHPARADRRAGNRLTLRALALVVVLAIAGVPRAWGASEQPPSGYAYVGPATLNLRKDLGPRAPTVASAKHGDRLEVLETRRRFVRVRTADKMEGWADGNLLVTQQQMDDLNALAKKAAELPSQGTGTVYDTLNMHTQPNRDAPSFYQIAEGASLEVVDHRLTLHGPAKQTTVSVRRVSTATPKRPKAKESKTAPVLPLPPPPAPPANWEELSRPSASDLPGYVPRVQSAGSSSAAADDWFLVRTRDGRAGWVLARMVSMSIPDDVAQYAEGHRITAYVSLADVRDQTKGETKHDWVWTTTSTNLSPYDFDSFRVFVWSTHRHHYETAFIERNVKGFYPVQTLGRPGEEERSFSVVIEEKDGKRYQRTYAFSGYHVRLVSKDPVEPRAPMPEVRTAHNFDDSPAPPAAEVSWAERWREWRERWFQR
ncbi:MAG TPA: hypothetical protein VN841_16945 [Bryobacteraceae bacterium]|nr:hypothetical protein [Bryobacteraceae bacterium]